MKIEIIIIHHKFPSWVDEGAKHWLKQMYGTHICHLKPSAKNTAPERMQAEALLIEEQLARHKNQCILLLDENGKNYTSTQFAKTIGTWKNQYDQLCFVIGGADGLHCSLKSQHTQHFALSTLTLSHPLAYLVLCEQIYRAEKILQGHPYHRT